MRSLEEIVAMNLKAEEKEASKVKPMVFYKQPTKLDLVRIPFIGSATPFGWERLEKTYQVDSSELDSFLNEVTTDGSIGYAIVSASFAGPQVATYKKQVEGGYK